MIIVFRLHFAICVGVAAGRLLEVTGTKKYPSNAQRKMLVQATGFVGAMCIASMILLYKKVKLTSRQLI